MKKVYKKPVVEIEAYTLSEAIAAGCGWVVNMGPEDFTGKTCSDFGDNPFAVVGNSLGASFYNGIDGPECDCYYTSGQEGYMTS